MIAKYLPMASNLKSKMEAAMILILLTYARFLIKFISLRFWRNHAGLMDLGSNGDFAARSATDDQIQQAHRIARRVAHIAEKSPFKAACLPRAMVCRWVLLASDIDTHIYIGARKAPGNEPVKLHAWLMLDDICLMGRREKDEFETFRPSKRNEPG